jgi:hypothetical protein
LSEALIATAPEVGGCIQEWQKLQAITGWMNVTLTIETDDGVEGRVTEVSVGDAGIGNVAFRGCVRSVYSELRFEPPMEGGRKVSHGLFFGPDLPPPSKELEPDLERLCDTVRTEALRPEEAGPDERLSTVMARVAQRLPRLQPYFVALAGDVPAGPRAVTFSRAITKALGREWDCPAFHALWIENFER